MNAEFNAEPVSCITACMGDTMWYISRDENHNYLCLFHRHRKTCFDLIYSRRLLIRNTHRHLSEFIWILNSETSFCNVVLTTEFGLQESGRSVQVKKLLISK